MQEHFTWTINNYNNQQLRGNEIHNTYMNVKLMLIYKKDIVNQLTYNEQKNHPIANMIPINIICKWNRTSVVKILWKHSPAMEDNGTKRLKKPSQLRNFKVTCEVGRQGQGGNAITELFNCRDMFISKAPARSSNLKYPKCTTHKS